MWDKLSPHVRLAVASEERYYIRFVQFAESVHQRHSITLALLCHFLSIHRGCKELKDVGRCQGGWRRIEMMHTTSGRWKGMLFPISANKILRLAMPSMDSMTRQTSNNTAASP